MVLSRKNQANSSRLPCVDSADFVQEPEDTTVPSTRATSGQSDGIQKEARHGGSGCHVSKVTSITYSGQAELGERPCVCCKSFNNVRKPSKKKLVQQNVKGEMADTYCYISDFIATEPFPTAVTDHSPYAGDKRRHHLSNLDNHPKRQHFIHGKPPMGSSNNVLTYGSIPATAPYTLPKRTDIVSREAKSQQSNETKPRGFLYGAEDTRVGHPKKKSSLPPWMVDKTSAELRKRALQTKDIEEDIARSRLEKANHRANKVAEQKKDLEMLQNYRPWGKPGGGAPRGIEIDRGATIRTRHVENLIDDKEQVLPLGRPGGGAPNRTESGKIKAKLATDTNVLLRAHRDGRPIDAIPVKNTQAEDYKTELDKLAEETRYRRHREKEEDFQHDLQTLQYNPFGRPGGGAPLKGGDGSPRTGLPLQLSNDIYELRATEPRHPHAFTGMDTEDDNQKFLPKSQATNRGKTANNTIYYSDEEMDKGFQFGMPGGGAPMRDKNGKVLAHGQQTLVKDKSGAIAKSPKKNSSHDKSEYFPFGRPGGGAPIRDEKGKLRTGVTGMVENEKMGKSRSNPEGMKARQEYLATLRKMQEDAEKQRVRERSDLLEPSSDVSQWLSRGKVGRPKYDPYTHEIKADPMVTSDVTRQRMNIQQQASEKSRDYHNELDEFLRQRYEQRKRDSIEQRQRSVEHAKTMERAWGRPGNGAPNAEKKKAKIELVPADHGTRWRDT